MWAEQSKLQHIVLYNNSIYIILVNVVWTVRPECVEATRALPLARLFLSHVTASVGEVLPFWRQTRENISRSTIIE